MSPELTHRQQVAVEDARRALAQEKAGDLPAGFKPENAAEYVAEYWLAYFRLQLEAVVQAFGEAQS